MGIVRLLIKTGIAYGAIYYTREVGVWGNHIETEKLYDGISAEIKPHWKNVTKSVPFEAPALPQTGEMRFLAKHYYNQGVKNTFYFIHMIPCYAGQLVKKTKDAVNKSLESPPPA